MKNEVAYKELKKLKAGRIPAWVKSKIEKGQKDLFEDIELAYETVKKCPKSKILELAHEFLKIDGLLEKESSLAEEMIDKCTDPIDFQWLPYILAKTGTLLNDNPELVSNMTKICTTKKGMNIPRYLHCLGLAEGLLDNHDYLLEELAEAWPKEAMIHYFSKEALYTEAGNIAFIPHIPEEILLNPKSGVVKSIIEDVPENNSAIEYLQKLPDNIQELPWIKTMIKVKLAKIVEDNRFHAHITPSIRQPKVDKLIPAMG